jgi:CMP-N,N'-diacetyllegionaminic acid synthase
MTVTAIVAARGGSVRLPRKALLPFAGSTLVGHKVRTLRSCALVTRVVVNSDDREIVAAAVDQGAHEIDGADYQGDTHRMLEDSARQVDGELILWAHPTNPLVTADTYDRAIQTYQEKAVHGFDSLLSVYAVRRHAWVDSAPLNYNPWQHPHPLAAQVRPVWFQDGAIFIQPRAQMLINRYFFGWKPVLFPMPDEEVGDIDTLKDYETAHGAKQNTD